MSIVHPTKDYPHGFSQQDQFKISEGFSDIAFALLLGAEIAHGQIKSDFTDQDLFYLNNILTRRGFIPLKNHMIKSFSYAARILFDILAKKVTN